MDIQERVYRVEIADTEKVQRLKNELSEARQAASDLQEELDRIKDGSAFAEMEQENAQLISGLRQTANEVKNFLVAIGNMTAGFSEKNQQIYDVLEKIRNGALTSMQAMKELGATPLETLTTRLEQVFEAVSNVQESINKIGGQAGASIGDSLNPIIPPIDEIVEKLNEILDVIRQINGKSIDIRIGSSGGIKKTDLHELELYKEQALEYLKITHELTNALSSTKGYLSIGYGGDNRDAYSDLVRRFMYAADDFDMEKIAGKIYGAMTMKGVSSAFGDITALKTVIDEIVSLNTKMGAQPLDIDTSGYDEATKKLEAYRGSLVETEKEHENAIQQLSDALSGSLAGKQSAPAISQNITGELTDLTPQLDAVRAKLEEVFNLSTIDLHLPEVVSKIQDAFSGSIFDLNGAARQSGAVQQNSGVVEQIEQIAERSIDASHSADILTESLQRVSQISVELSGENIEEIGGALKSGGVDGDVADKIASAFDGLSGRIKDVKVRFNELGDGSENVGQVIVNAMTDAGKEIQRVITLLRDEEGAPDYNVSGSAKVKFDLAEQFKEATSAAKVYYALLQKMAQPSVSSQYLRQNVEEQNGSFVAKAEDVREYVSQLNAAKAAMDSYMSTLSTDNSTEKQRNDLEELVATMQKRIDLMMETASRADAERAQKEENATLEEANKLLQRMIQLRDEYANKLKVRISGAFGDNEKNIVELQELLKNGINADNIDAVKAKLLQMNDATNENDRSMRSLGNSSKSTFSGMMRYMAMTFSSYRLIMMAVREIKKMISASIELDSAMTQMQIVTKASDATMRQFGQTAAQVAKETATSISDVIDSATVFARLGYSLDESAILSKFTGMLQRVGNIDVSDAQDAITAIIKAYDIDAKDIEAVMDRLVEVGNNFPISVSQIAEGMNNAAASLSAAGNSFEESVALLTAANTIVQNASKASTGLRTIAARLRNTKAELDELGEEPIATPKYEELVKQLTDYNVSLLDAAGSYRSTYEIMRDLANVWNDIPTNIQAAITTALAGTRQQAIFNSIISQFQEASGAMDAMANSAGALTGAYDNYMNTAQAHIDQFKAAFQELAQTAVDRGLVSTTADIGRFFVNVLNWILKIVDAATGLKTVLVGIAGAVITLKIDTILDKMKALGKALSDLKLRLVSLEGTSQGALMSGAASITVGIVAAMAMVNALNRYYEKKRLQLEQTYDEAFKNASGAGNIFQMYDAYANARNAYEDNVESKQKLTDATLQLVHALGLEEDAIGRSAAELNNLTAQELETAISDAHRSIRAAQNALNDIVRADASSIRNLKAPLTTIAGLYNEYDIFSDDQAKQADALISLYNKLISKRTELDQKITSGAGGRGSVLGSYEAEAQAVDEALSLIEGDVKDLIAAREVLAQREKEHQRIQLDAKLLNAEESGEIHKRINEIRALADAFNELTNGNVDYRLRPIISAEDMKKVYPEFDSGDLATLYDTTFTIGQGEATYTVAVTPIMEDGTILTPDALRSYVDTLVTDSGIDALLNSDENRLVIQVSPGDYDEEYWSEFESRIYDVKQEHADLVLSMQEDYGACFDHIAKMIAGFYNGFQTDTSSARAALQKMLSAEEFEGTYKKLQQFAKSLNGITSDNITELASESAELASVLQMDGMDARFLAHVLQEELTGHNGLSLITDDALKLNEALNSLSDEYNRLSAARSKYESGKSTKDRDDDFRSMAEAYKTLNEELEKGRINSDDLWDAAEYLFGTDQLEEWNFDIDKVRETIEKNKVVFEDADSAGAGFLTRLKEISDENGNVVDSNGEVIASIQQLEDGSVKFDIDEFRLDELSKKLGISRDAIIACSKALSVFGRVDMADMGQVFDALKEIGLGGDFGTGGVVNATEAYNMLRETLGYNAKEAADVMAGLEDMGVTLINLNTPVDQLAQQFVSLGVAEENAGVFTVNADSLIGLMQQLQLTDEQAAQLVTSLSEANNVSLVDATGDAESLDDALKKVNKASFKSAKDAAGGLSKELDISKMSAKELYNELNKLVRTNYTIQLDRRQLEDAYRRALELRNLLNGASPSGPQEDSRGYPSSHGAHGITNAAPGATLVGEEEPELWVQDGRAQLVGVHGPEIIETKAGDRIFKGSDTRKILKNVRFIRGTIPAMSYGGTVSIPGWSPSTGSTSSYSGGSSGSSGTSNSSSSSKKGESAFEKEYKRHQHLLKMEAETQREYLTWLNDAYKKAYNNNQIELEDYWKYEEEVYSGMKDLFMDYLNDIEHEIDMIGEDKSRVNRVVELYTTAVKSVEKEIAAARKAGLKDTDEYIQQLQKKIKDYREALTSMREDARKEVDESEQELVDLRIKMIKQEIDDRKDGLNKQLSDLKDFYQKQKDMLRDSRDEEKYLDDQAEKRKKVADIERELSALQRDNSAWAAKRRLELEKDLADARKELREFEKDHAIEMAQEELDRIAELREDEINAQIEDLENITPHEIYEQALHDIRNATNELFNESVEWNNVYGDGIEKNIIDKWDRAKTAFEDYWNTVRAAESGGNSTVMRFAGGFHRYAQSIGTPLSTRLGYASGTFNAAPGFSMLDEFGTETIFQSKTGKKYKMFTGGEKVLNAKASEFLYKFATSGGEFLSKLVNGASNSFNYLTGGGRRLAVEAVNMGDIVINGNADQSTVSEIRRAQRDALENLLREFDRLSK